MKTEKTYKKLNLILGLILLIFLIYSFDFSLGWGMNLMFPNIYFITHGTGNNGFNTFFWNENGLIESLQAITLLIIIIILINTYLTKNKSKLIKIFLILKIIGITYIFLEEISWGQHYLKFESPKLFINEESLLFNKQKEFNLHNMSNLFNELPRTLILIWCSLSIPLVRFIKFSKINDLRFIIEPSKNLIILSYTILLVSIPDLLINKLDLINNSKLFIFNNDGFQKYNIYQLLLSILSFNFIRFSELQELLFYYYFLWHTLFLRNTIFNKNI